MQAIGYYISLPFLYGLSYLPFWLLYVFSDLTFFLVYYIIGYRKKVVHQNLANAFPDRSPAERLTIERQFYRFFCDLIFETVKCLTISERELLRRVEFPEDAAFYETARQQRSIIAVMGHYGNWEMGRARYSLQGVYPNYAIYKPLSNPYFDRLFIGLRTRFDGRLYPMKQAFKGMLANRAELTTTTFISDQTPSPKHAYWTSFLHQPTPVYLGPEKIAQKLNLPVVFVNLHRKKRGYYRIDSELIVDDPQAYKEGEITELHLKKLEAVIETDPAFWLWTHRRWKHKPPA